MPASALPTLSAQFGAPPIYLWEHFFFQPIDATLYNQATDLARRISQISRGKKTLLLSDNADTIGKLGEFVVRDYFQRYLDELGVPWASYVDQVNPKGGDECDLRFGDLKIDVKTRQLHVDLTIAPNFDLRVPETETQKAMDLFVLAGYCPSSRYGYAIGYATWDELQAKPVRTDIRYPAKCIPLSELHPMQTFADYLSGKYSG